MDTIFKLWKTVKNSLFKNKERKSIIKYTNNKKTDENVISAIFIICIYIDFYNNYSTNFKN